jgi:predicted ATPase
LHKLICIDKSGSLIFEDVKISVGLQQDVVCFTLPINNENNSKVLMMLTSMRAQQFKSWEGTGELPLAPLTGFFGTNSSGKTSLLQVLLLLKQTAESSDRGLVLNTEGLNTDSEDRTNIATISELTRSGASHLEFQLEWQLPEALSIESIRGTKTTRKQLTRLNFRTKISSGKTAPHVEFFTYKGDGIEAGMRFKASDNYMVEAVVEGHTLTQAQGRPFKKVSAPVKCYGFSDEALRYYQDSGFLNDLVYSFETRMRDIYYLGPLRGYPKRQYPWGRGRMVDVGRKGENTVAVLLSTSEKNYKVAGKRNKVTLSERIAMWLKEMRMLDSFRTQAITDTFYQVLVKRHPDSPEVLLPDVGFGVSQVLPVLTLCYSTPEGSTIIFEQPEIHLHPKVQGYLADVFIDVIKTRNVQIIVESHSEHLLRRLQLRIAEEQLDVDKTALYFCDSSAKGSTIKPLQLDEYGNITNWPPEFFGDITKELINMTKAGLKRRSNGA